jgi:hypothetical protein
LALKIVKDQLHSKRVESIGFDLQSRPCNIDMGPSHALLNKFLQKCSGLASSSVNVGTNVFEIRI